jgi:hypothetical protein
MTAIARHIRAFAADEDGNGTIEFVLMLPLMFFFFMSTFELGMTMTRQVMLDRGVDLVVRELRLGTYAGLNDEELTERVKEELCDFAQIIPDCLDAVRLEMRVIDPLAWGNMPNQATCIDRGNALQPPATFNQGTVNDLLIMRACVLFTPYIPTSALGAIIPRHSGDEYALVSISSYAVEPM